MKRRDFLRITSLYGAGGLLFSSLPFNGIAQTIDPICFQPDPLIKLCDDGAIIVYVRKQEMGQGVHTSLPMIVAEEMEADWKNIRSEIAPFDYESRNQYTTVGNSSVKNNWASLRKAGAAAREMLVAAAGKHWSTDIKYCQPENGKVINTITNETILYKDLIIIASKLPVPQNPVLKNYKDFKLVGKGGKKINALEIVTGKTKFGIDVKLPGMLYALVLRSPVYGGMIKTCNAEAAKKTEGVKQIVEIKDLGGGIGMRNGIAVVADSFWSAQKGRDALQVSWDLGKNRGANSEAYSKRLKQAVTEPASAVMAEKVIETISDTPSVRNIDAHYELPFLAHATLEPVNCTAQYKEGKFELWGGFQIPGWIADRLPPLFGIKKEDITINMMLMGGGFGRRAYMDNIAEAMQIAKAAGVPVKLYWTRVDDMQNDLYRPAYYHQLSASIDEKNNIRNWEHHIAGSPFQFTDSKNESRPDDMKAEGYGGAANDLYYPVANYKALFHLVEPPIPTGAWRSVSYSHNSFVVESFIDEIAHHQNLDPLAYRLQLLSPLQPTEIQPNLYNRKIKYDPSRLVAVLNTVADEIGWNLPKLAGHFYGIASCPFPGSKAYAAHAFDISVNKSKKIIIHKVVAAMDCGIAIDPDGVAAQIEGAFVFALSAVLRGEITLLNGKVQQSTLADYGLLRFNEMPPLKIHIIKSEADPGSIGEISVPSVAPALCNAIFAATRFRIRKLPISKEGFFI